jgi:hypothetical protein
MPANGGNADHALIECVLRPYKACRYNKERAVIVIVSSINRTTNRDAACYYQRHHYKHHAIANSNKLLRVLS